MSNPFIDRLNFFYKSTNQHGVHSPFVYSLVTKCFYDKSSYLEYKRIKKTVPKEQLSNKKAQLLFRLERYFNFKSVLLSQKTNRQITEALTIANPEIKTIDITDIKNNEQKLDLCYLETLDFSNFENQIEKLLSHTHNDSLLLIDKIHASASSKKHWLSLKDHSKTTVTIDTYSYGFVFFRKEQPKEHFVIRL